MRLRTLLVPSAVLASVGTFLYTRLKRRLPRPAYKVPSVKPDLASFDETTVSATWVGHSTVLIHWYGLKILTDPVFSKRIGVHLGPVTIGMKRHTAPALSIEEVGPVDVILLSHAHMDHFDHKSLKRLITPDTVVISAPWTSKLLRKYKSLQTIEMHPHDKLTLASGLHVHAIPVAHWGNRFPWDKHMGYNGYVLKYKGVRMLFAGDTAYTESFNGLASKEPIDLAFFPIGAYQPDSFQEAHCTPEQAWTMFKQSGAKRFFPMHWDTFVLSYEPVEEPYARLVAAAKLERDQIVIKAHGESITL
ncbi:MBL fold metallo-hydrolase [Exiguobacterium sp. AB2]|uniref:MBL fold metallo-hydrolase n=1 Tax=Exiguobacterium sp. AB2 TaxID=1484479 RepID=UPI0004A8CF6E|nr:MBL fold metallo-hydrolase [Exiguobacterium sp. AB2]KDN59385.1 beta-lactamase [Exiguobacterium sp. AB2]